MRIDFAAPSAGGFAGRPEATGVAGMEASTASGLIVPTLSQGIPAVIEGSTQDRHSAVLAMRMLEAGYLKETDEGNPRSLCEIAAERWLSPLRRLLTCFDGESSIGLHWDKDLDSWTVNGQCTGTPVRMLRPENFDQSDIARALFRAAYWEIEDGSGGVFILTPHVAFWEAGCYWFAGATDDEEFLLEMSCHYEDEEEIKSLKKPSDILKDLPEWSRPEKRVGKAWRKKEISDLDLRIIGKTEKEGSRLQKLSKAILEVRRLRKHVPPDAMSTATEYQTAWLPLALRWSSTDFIGQIYDDRGNELMNSGEYEETFLVHLLDTSSPQGFAASMARFEKAVRLESARHAIIELITEETTWYS